MSTLDDERRRRANISASLRKRYANKPPPGPGLAEMLAARAPGMCAFCDDPALRRSERPSAKAKRAKRGGDDVQHTCGEPECMTARHRCWRRDQQAAIRAVLAAVARLDAVSESSVAAATGSPFNKRESNHV